MEQKQTTNLHLLPNLPKPFYDSPCVYFPPDEILICGGQRNVNCYSYHIKKQRYKFICSYLNPFLLYGHTVVSYFYSIPHSLNRNGQDTGNNIFIVLSFGGIGSAAPYHTMVMKYKSVWSYDYSGDDGDDENNGFQGRNRNNRKNFYRNDEDFIHSCPNNKWCSYSTLSISPDLVGARALIGRSQTQHLLFITHSTRNIDVIDLSSLQYLKCIKQDILPVSETNDVSYHCFVSLNDMNKKEKEKEKDGDYNFILMSKGETLLIQYDEIHKEFYYQKLSFQSSFKDYYRYATACLLDYHCIFIFGGCSMNNYKTVNDIWKFDIKQKNWKKCKSKMPFAMAHAIAITTENNSFIHIIGGKDDKNTQQHTHYVTSALAPEYIESILEYWIRGINLKKGWIVEFDMIIFNYINGEPVNMKKRLVIPTESF